MSSSVSPINDADITLTAGDIRLTVSPFGASLRGLSRGSDVVITEYRGAANKVAGQGDVLIPYPGRVKEAAYTFGGKAYKLPQNDRESPSAIHGFVREVDWTIVEQSSTAITFGYKLDAAEYAAKGYPFSLDIKITYRAVPTGMECSYAIANVGVDAAPVAIGFHPYFTIGSDRINADSLTLPFSSYLEFEGLLPTGKVLPIDGAPVDFREKHALADTRLNTCYLNPKRDADGDIRVILGNDASGRSVTVWMDEAFNYVVVYSGDPLPENLRRTSLAIEPMTCASDAFNHPEWGLINLAPGDITRGAWGVDVN